MALPNGSALRSLIGACVLSSVASLPFHLVPLILVALIADSRASVANAGWVASAMLIGQLTTALALPALRIVHVTRNLASGAAVLLLTALGISIAANYSILLLGWFLVGQCCGVLSYLGTMAAAQFPRRAFAFSLRLAIILICAGFASGVLLVSNMLVSYPNLVLMLILTLSPMLLVGFALRGPAEATKDVHEYSLFKLRSVVRSSGLITVYFFFVGQTGFIAYIIQQAIGRGMTLESSAWSLAAMKVAAGLWILYSTRFELEDAKEARFSRLTLLLVASISMLTFSHDTIVFFPALFALEIALNKLSAKLQAAVVAARPEFSGPWLTGVILLGAATGPPLNGFIIYVGLDFVFVVIAVSSALAPLLWLRFGNSNAKGVEQMGEDLASTSIK